MHDLFKDMVTFDSHGERLYSFRFLAEEIILRILIRK